MSQRMLNSIQQWIHPKDDDSNVISATLHMITITLISMSLVDLTWFSISGNACVPYLTLGEFFWFGWNDDIDYTDYDCVNSKIVNMMRITILLCFMTIIFALMGFFLEIIGPKHFLYKSLRKYAIMATCTVIWIMVIIALSYYIVVLLEDSLAKVYPKVISSVTYGIGFYLIVASGGVTCCGIVYTLLPIRTSTYFRDDDRCLLDAFDDGLDTFHSPTPPPPYCLPPPPYTP